jgi:hypothetical protein
MITANEIRAAHVRNLLAAILLHRRASCRTGDLWDVLRRRLRVGSPAQNSWRRAFIRTAQVARTYALQMRPPAQ